jgi:hypothetical protein
MAPPQVEQVTELDDTRSDLSLVFCRAAREGIHYPDDVVGLLKSQGIQTGTLTGPQSNHARSMVDSSYRTGGGRGTICKSVDLRDSSLAQGAKRQTSPIREREIKNHRQHRSRRRARPCGHYQARKAARRRACH